MPDAAPLLVSVVIPVFNEAENLVLLHRELDEACRDLEDARLEILFVDDGSTDRSFSVLEEIASRDPRVRVVKLTRNFGSHAAILAGLTRAEGDVAVNLSSDLQDPPELIGRLLARWREGNDVVWAVRESRGREDGRVKVRLANLFYFLARKFAMKETPATGTDIVLMGRLGQKGVSGFFGWYTETDREEAREALREVELEAFADRSFSALSGGQRQRTLIARALCGQPELLLLDEPMANVDPLVEERLFDILRELNQRMTILMVTHDLGFVPEMIKSVICVNRRIVVHPTSDITGEIIKEVYGGDFRIVRHDHRCSEQRHTHG